MTKIDVVVTWVDPNDPKWIKEKNQYLTEEEKKLNGVEKFRDWNLFKYWFRALEKYAPWINNVFFVTYGHIPSWLNQDNSKLRILRHDDFMPSEALPTFNSQAIELCLGNIKDLNENFIYFNDDVFLNNEVRPEDFFVKGKPCDTALFNVVTPHFGGIEHAIVNNLELINKYFYKRDIEKKYFLNFYNYRYGMNILRNFLLYPWKNFTGFFEPHSAVSLKKSTFKKIWNLEKNTLNETVNSKFREKSNLNFWLMRYWQICEGDIYPRKPNFSKMCYVNDEINFLSNEIANGKSKVLCINDSNDISDYENRKEKLIAAFEAKYPTKSSFEV